MGAARSRAVCARCCLREHSRFPTLNSSLPNPTTTSTMPPSPGVRSPPSDKMKQNILKESSAGWSNTISPLRISKRDTNGSAGSDSGTDGSLKLPDGPGVARRQSSSYKHMFHNNLVSKSPFKSQQVPKVQRSNIPQLPSRLIGSPRGMRKISGEKRPRPESLVQQAEQENQQRTRELGFKRRQSKGFQNLTVKEPVTKSPFKRVVSPPSSSASAPIQITLPRDLKSIDDDVTSTEDVDSLSSKGHTHIEYLMPEVPPAPPPKPSPSLSRSSTPQPIGQQHSPLRVSPLPSALQVSPARSSLVSRRLKGPRSRSLSGSPSDTPTRRERRKTVTFDERCDVVEFDRESHEDVFMDTDDEDVYGHPEPAQEDTSLEVMHSLPYLELCQIHSNCYQGYLDRFNCPPQSHLIVLLRRVALPPPDAITRYGHTAASARPFDAPRPRPL